MLNCFNIQPVCPKYRYIARAIESVFRYNYFDRMCFAEPAGGGMGAGRATHSRRFRGSSGVTRRVRLAADRAPVHAAQVSPHSSTVLFPSPHIYVNVHVCESLFFNNNKSCSGFNPFKR